MKMRIITVAIITLLLTVGLQAQDLSDILRYSLYDYGSTARSMGVGSSMSPLGADLSIASTNPAGLGGFYKSEFTITAGLPISSVKTSFAQLENSNSFTPFKIHNLGVVFTSRPNSITIKTFNLAIGLNTLANFDRNIAYQGTSAGTRVERFLERAIDNTLSELSDFEEGLAYDAELITDIDSNLIYESDFVTLDEEVFKREIIDERGGIQELYLSMGSNIGDNISLGATLGIPILSYSRSSQYLEEDQTGSIANFQDYVYTQNVQSDGGGVNLKLGVIFKPTSKVRLSAAIHSPSWLFITDEYSSSVDFRLDGETNGVIAESPVGSSEYMIRTPWRANVGAGIIYRLDDVRGFFSGEVEYVDYSNAYFKITEGGGQGFNPIIARNLNTEIGNNLTSTINIKLGTELALHHWRVRGGINLSQSPYGDDALFSVDPSFSFGLGYRGNQTYIDVAYRYIQSSSQYIPYKLDNKSAEQMVAIDNSAHRIALTFGYKI